MHSICFLWTWTCLKEVQQNCNQTAGPSWCMAFISKPYNSPELFQCRNKTGNNVSHGQYIVERVATQMVGVNKASSLSTSWGTDSPLHWERTKFPSDIYRWKKSLFSAAIALTGKCLSVLMVYITRAIYYMKNLLRWLAVSSSPSYEIVSSLGRSEERSTNRAIYSNLCWWWCQPVLRRLFTQFVISHHGP